MLVVVALLFAGLAQSASAHPLVVTPPPGMVGEPLPPHALARVGTRLVTKRSYRRWFYLAADGRRPRPGSSRHARLRREAMEFLIEAAWVELEAREHRITVSRRFLRRFFRRQKRAAFRDEREYRRFLRGGPLSERHILYRLKLDLLQGRLVRHAIQPGDAADETRQLDVYTRDFRRKWRARTACAHAYVMKDCSRGVPRLPLRSE